MSEDKNNSVPQIIEKGYQPVHEGYQPKSIDIKGPVVKGGYQPPISEKSNPTNPPPSKK